MSDSLAAPPRWNIRWVVPTAANVPNEGLRERLVPILAKGKHPENGPLIGVDPPPVMVPLVTGIARFGGRLLRAELDGSAIRAVDGAGGATSERGLPQVAEAAGTRRKTRRL